LEGVIADSLSSNSAGAQWPLQAGFLRRVSEHKPTFTVEPPKTKRKKLEFGYFALVYRRLLAMTTLSMPILIGMAMSVLDELTPKVP
jgi:hypothetical protein